ncbi:MAG: hypothetical protein J6W29_10025 [Neisseriaceae bacterium]|nr:hypothetical protein [Neisseriaceae bacterium]
MSSEQLFSQAFRLDGYFLDNASIFLSGCLKGLSKRYLKTKQLLTVFRPPEKVGRMK